MTSHVSAAREIIKYADNFHYFAEKCTGFVWTSQQHKLINRIEKTNPPDGLMFAAHRQEGITTVMAVYLVWLMLFHGENTMYITLNTPVQRMVMEIIQQVHQQLPTELQRACRITRNSISCDGATTTIMNYTTYTSLANATRGISIGMVYVDNFEYVLERHCSESESIWDFVNCPYFAKRAVINCEYSRTTTPSHFNKFKSVLLALDGIPATYQGGRPWHIYGSSTPINLMGNMHQFWQPDMADSFTREYKMEYTSQF